MNKRSSVINGFCRGFCLLLLMCFLLCACTGGAADEPEKEYVSVTLVDSVFFTADEPSQRVKYGGTASFTLKMRPGFSFVSCSYSDYEAAERDEECILTLRNVTRPSRVTVQADSVPEEADTNPVFSCSIRYVFNDGTQREKTEHYTLNKRDAALNSHKRVCNSKTAVIVRVYSYLNRRKRVLAAKILKISHNLFCY